MEKATFTFGTGQAGADLIVLKTWFKLALPNLRLRDDKIMHTWKHILKDETAGTLLIIFSG